MTNRRDWMTALLGVLGAAKSARPRAAEETTLKLDGKRVSSVKNLEGRHSRVAVVEADGTLRMLTRRHSFPDNDYDPTLNEGRVYVVGVGEVKLVHTIELDGTVKTYDIIGDFQIYAWRKLDDEINDWYAKSGFENSNNWENIGGVASRTVKAKSSSRAFGYDFEVLIVKARGGVFYDGNGVRYAGPEAEAL